MERKKKHNNHTLFELTLTARAVKKTAKVPLLGQTQWVTSSPGDVLAMQLFRSQEPVTSMNPQDKFHEFDWFCTCFNCRSTQILLCLSRLKVGTATVTTREFILNSKSVPSLVIKKYLNWIITIMIESKI